jgi:branched-chain amino acid transport system permease protein
MLVASGLALLFGIASIASFMEGDIMMIGGYLLFFLLTGLNMNPMLAIVCSAVSMFFIGITIGRLVYQRLRSSARVRALGGADAWVFNTFIITLGVSFIIENMVLISLGPFYHGINYLYPGSIDLLGLPIATDRVFLVILSMSVLVLLWFFLKYHKLGRSIRAVGMNAKVASLLGVNVDRIYLLVVGLSTILGGLAGGFYMAMYSVYPTMGTGPSLKAWVIVLLGGLGNMKGALVCSVILATVESLAYYFISAGWQDVISLGVLIVVILIRPYGIFGTEVKGIWER